MAKQPTQTPAALPPSHLEAMAAAGFEALSWQNVSVLVAKPDGTEGSEWLPRHLVNWDRRSFIEFREAGAGNYDFAGWEPRQGFGYGGRYPTVQGAIGWCAWYARQTTPKEGS